MKYIKTILWLNVIAFSMFILGVIYLTPKYFLDDLIPVWIKLVVGTFLTLMFFAILDNFVKLFREYKRHKKFENQSENNNQEEQE